MHGTRYYTTADECVRNMRMGTYMYCICLQDTHKHDLPVNTPAWKMMKKINKHEQRTHLNKFPPKNGLTPKLLERGRSVLVMRARYRSAGLTLHQRGWMDAG